MPRIDSLPGIKIIRGFRGVLDFYMQRGRAYVRSWPVTPRRHLTPATLAAAATFGQVLKSYRLLADTVLAAFQEDAADHERTARDIFVAAVHGHLHEAAMSDFLTLLQACRDSLAALEALLGALHDVGADELDVHVEWSALPSGAASAARQVTQTAHLATIATLEEALETVATDRLIVKGENQLFTIQAVVALHRTAAISGAGGYIDTVPCPAGTYWVIHTVSAHNGTTAPTMINFSNRHNLADVPFHEETKAFAIGERSIWGGVTLLDVDDVIRAYFVGSLGGDTVHIDITGYRITVET